MDGSQQRREWLTSITAKARSGERWVYAEGNFAGSAPWTVSVTDGFPQTIVVTYSIADVFLAVPSTAPAAPIAAPVATPASSTGSPWGAVAVGGAVVLAGAGTAWWWLRKKRRA